MTPTIRLIPEKKLIGKCLRMSLIDNKTHDLWSSFMPRRKEIANSIGTDLYSMQIYGELYFNDFNPNNIFEKCAAIEVADFENIPTEMNAIVLPAGLYAVFDYVGDQANAGKIFEYIFTNWLPNSEYNLDNRPHFELLGEKYKNGDPNSEEEIWIPVI